MARGDLQRHMQKYIKEKLDWDVDLSELEIVFESSMNMVKDVFTVGQDIRVKCQVKPGICKDYENVVRCLCNR